MAAAEWEHRQRKAYSMWVASILGEKAFDVASFAHGDSFYRLVETLLQKELKFNWRKQKAQPNKMEVISSLQLALDEMRERVRIDLDGRDIYNVNVKLILGMLWQFILTFQVSSKEELLKWCSEMAGHFGVNVSNFTSSWSSGVAFASLVCALNPQSLPAERVREMKKEDAKENLEVAFQKAEEMGILRFLEVDEMLEHPNERIVVLYLSFIYRKWKESAPAPLPPLEDERDRLRSDLETLKEKYTSLSGNFDQLQNVEMSYLRSQLDEMVHKYQELRKKYSDLQKQSATEIEYLITAQKELVKQLEEAKEGRKKLNKKMKSLKGKLRILEAENKSSASLSRPPPPSSEFVCIVCTSVLSSSRLWEEYPRDMEQATLTHNTLVRQLADYYQGYEMKSEGDAFTLVFGDLENALVFCCKVQLLLMEEAWPQAILSDKDCRLEVSPKDDSQHIFRGLRVKIGVHSGIPHRQEDPVTKKTNFIGPVLTRAQSLCKAAGGGQVLMTMDSWRSVVGEREKESDGLADVLMILLGEFNFSEIGLVEEVGQLSHAKLCDRYFAPILTDSNLNAVTEVLAEELNRLSEENKKLKMTLTQLETRASECNQRAQLMQTWLETMADPDSDADSMSVSITRSISTLAHERDVLIEEMNQLKTENEQLSEYLEKLNEDLREAKSLAHGLKEKISTIKEERGSLKEENRSLRKERDKLRDECEMTEREIGELNETIKSLKSKKIEETLVTWSHPSFETNESVEENKEPKELRRKSSFIHKLLMKKE